MRAIDLARLLLLYPDADILIDTRSDKSQVPASQPFRDIDEALSFKSSHKVQVVIVLGSEHGYGRAT